MRARPPRPGRGGARGRRALRRAPRRAATGCRSPCSRRRSPRGSTSPTASSTCGRPIRSAATSRAFDAAVAAAGYNAYHELIRFGVPSLFVPMRRQTDDQAARARFAAERGRGPRRRAPGLRPGSRRSSTACSTTASARRIRARLRELRPATAPPRRPPGSRSWQPPSGPARGPVAPLAQVRCASPLASARGGRPVRRPAARPRRGVRQADDPAAAAADRRPRLRASSPAAMARRRRRRAGAARPIAPERVLVVTDSLELAPLRRAGVGFEHVPGADEPQAAARGRDYEAFVRAPPRADPGRAPAPDARARRGRHGAERLAAFGTLSR